MSIDDLTLIRATHVSSYIPVPIYVFPGGSFSRVSLSSSCSSFFSHRFCLEQLDARGAILIWSGSLPPFRSLIATKRNVVLVSWDLVGAASRLSFQPVSSNLCEIFRPFHVAQLLHFNVCVSTLHVRFLPNAGMICDENVGFHEKVH